MGNSVGIHHYLEIVYPTTLSATVTSREGGYDISPFNADVIYMRNQESCATGCGAKIKFQRKVKTLRTTYTCKTSFRNKFGRSVRVGTDETVIAEGKDVKGLKTSVKTKLASKMNISEEDVRMYFEETHWELLDNGNDSAVSECYVYHCYYSYDWVAFSWERNELHLTPGDDLTFEYRGKRYLKIHPVHCYREEGPHIGYNDLDKLKVQSENSELRFDHSNGVHKACVKIAYDPKYVENGVYIGHLEKRAVIAPSFEDTCKDIIASPKEPINNERKDIIKELFKDKSIEEIMDICRNSLSMQPGLFKGTVIAFSRMNPKDLKNVLETLEGVAEAYSPVSPVITPVLGIAKVVKAGGRDAIVLIVAMELLYEAIKNIHNWWTGRDWRDCVKEIFRAFVGVGVGFLGGYAGVLVGTVGGPLGMVAGAIVGGVGGQMKLKNKWSCS